jgi:predicted component of type VI protein secretion system
MNRICIAALMTVMICGPGCGPSELEKFEATEKLLSAWDVGKRIKGSGYRPDYIRMLIEAGADVNARDGMGQTPLMFATRNSTPEVVTLLIEAGADVNARASSGRTPLSRANGRVFPEIIKILKAAGAQE